jgi:O-methyltransferase
MMSRLRDFLQKLLPRPVFFFLRALHNWRDVAACLSFLADNSLGISFPARLRIVKRLYSISYHVASPHDQEDILQYIRGILSLPRSVEGVLVEAGCYKGASTAKLSLAADIVGRDLVVFDSFQGLPQNAVRPDNDIFGRGYDLFAGNYAGDLDTVRANVTKFGAINRCRFIPGWFDDTMPAFKEPVAAAFLDVDLASSTRTCLKYLFPLLAPGGVIYSHDGKFLQVIEVFNDDDFWLKELGCTKPPMPGLGKQQLIKLVKEPISPGRLTEPRLS